MLIFSGRIKLRKGAQIMLDMKNCTLCPRECRVDRSRGVGFCKAGDKLKIARAALHFWEEPCISGERGSGTVFFSHCNLRCVYCQNGKISSGGFGKEITPAHLGEIFLKLQKDGAHNINLVTPTPYVPLIMEALGSVRGKLSIPTVYNCGGYEKPEIIRALDNYIDIYLTDFKYYDKNSAKEYSMAENYVASALPALSEMLKTKGEPVLENGIMKRGVIVRHLVLPSKRQESINLLKRLKQEFGVDSFILSLMSQYFPPENLEAFPEINRKVTTFEYESVVSAALDLGFDAAYVQTKGCANKYFVPDFDLFGVD